MWFRPLSITMVGWSLPVGGVLICASLWAPILFAQLAPVKWSDRLRISNRIVSRRFSSRSPQKLHTIKKALAKFLLGHTKTLAQVSALSTERNHDKVAPLNDVVASDSISLREAAQDLLKAQKTRPLHIGYRLDLWAVLEACLTATATDTTQLQHVISITQHPNVESPKQEQTSTDPARKGNGTKNHKQD